MFTCRKKRDKGENTQINSNYTQCASSLAGCGLLGIYCTIHKWINIMIVTRPIHRPVMTLCPEPRTSNIFNSAHLKTNVHRVLILFLYS